MSWMREHSSPLSLPLAQSVGKGAASHRVLALLASVLCFFPKLSQFPFLKPLICTCTRTHTHTYSGGDIQEEEQDPKFQGQLLPTTEQVYGSGEVSVGILILSFSLSVSLSSSEGTPSISEPCTYMEN